MGILSLESSSSLFERVASLVLVAPAGSTAPTAARLSLTPERRHISEDLSREAYFGFLLASATKAVGEQEVAGRTEA